MLTHPNLSLVWLSNGRRRGFQLLAAHTVQISWSLITQLSSFTPYFQSDFFGWILLSTEHTGDCLVGIHGHFLLETENIKELRSSWNHIGAGATWQDESLSGPNMLYTCAPDADFCKDSVFSYFLRGTEWRCSEGNEILIYANFKLCAWYLYLIKTLFVIGILWECSRDSRWSVLKVPCEWRYGCNMTLPMNRVGSRSTVCYLVASY